MEAVPKLAGMRLAYGDQSIRLAMDFSLQQPVVERALRVNSAHHARTNLGAARRYEREKMVVREIGVEKLEAAGNLPESMNVDRHAKGKALGRQSKLVVNRKPHLSKPGRKISRAHRVHGHLDEVAAPNQLASHRGHRLSRPGPYGGSEQLEDPHPAKRPERNGRGGHR